MMWSIDQAIKLCLFSKLVYLEDEQERAEAAFEKEHTVPCFVDIPETDTQAMLFSNCNSLSLVFRGTTCLKDWITNSRFDLVPGPFGELCHEGFLEAVNSAMPNLTAMLSGFDPAGKKLYVGGHSLGGGLATLFVAHCLEAGRPVHGLYTFGSPRVGSHAFASRFNREFYFKTFRFVNNNDVVTRVPMRSQGYDHVGIIRYFKESGELSWNISDWNRFLDRIHGTVDDLFEAGIDDIKDHSIDEYYRLLTAAKKEGAHDQQS